jgi:hypothetical protein
MRSFTEFTLSPKSSPFVSLRVTDGEGFRMTLRARFFALLRMTKKKAFSTACHNITPENTKMVDCLF